MGGFKSIFTRRRCLSGNAKEKFFGALSGTVCRTGPTFVGDPSPDIQQRIPVENSNEKQIGSSQSLGIRCFDAGSLALFGGAAGVLPLQTAGRVWLSLQLRRASTARGKQRPMSYIFVVLHMCECNFLSLANIYAV